VAAATAFISVLVAGSIVSTLLAVRATRAEKRTENLIDFMLGEFLSEVQKAGRLDLLEKVVAQAMPYFASREPDGLSDDALLLKVKSLRRAGEIQIKKARYTEASESLAAAYVRAAALVARHPTNGEMLFERAQVEFYISDVHRRRGDFAVAGEWTARYRDSGAQLVKLDPANPRWQQEVVYGHHNFAVNEFDQGNLESARNELLAKLAMSEKMAAAKPADPALQFSVANTISFLGTVAERRGDFSEALERYRDQTSRLEALLARDSKDMGMRQSAALALSLQVDVLAATGRRAEAREILTRALAYFDTVVAHDPANARWLNNSLTTRVKEVWLDRAEGRVPLAVNRLEEIRPRIERLAVTEPSDRNLAGLLVTVWRLEAELRQTAGRADASDAANRAVECAASVVKPGLVDSKILGECAQAHVIAGIIAESTGQRDPALRHWRRVLEMLEARLLDSNDWRFLDPAARALAFVGRVDESRAIITRLHTLGYRPLQPWPEAIAATLPASSPQNK
jgi:tetratricopeptide (TPR) repeat protein